MPLALRLNDLLGLAGAEVDVGCLASMFKWPSECGAECGAQHALGVTVRRATLLF